MTVVILIRHGENDQVGKRLSGRLPGLSLNERGQQQAREVAEALSAAPLKAIYASPMERARETAAPLAQAKGLETRICPGLNELDFGEWQGQTLEELNQLEAWKTVQQAPAEFTFPGGESFVGAQQRAARAIEEIVAAHAREDVVACFTHSDVARLLMAHYLDMPLNSFQRVVIGTASLSVLMFAEAGQPPVVWCVNQAARWAFPEPPRPKTPESTEPA